MYTYDDEKSVLEMEKQRLGEYMYYGDSTEQWSECTECGKSVFDEKLYHIPENGLMCISCAADRLYNKLYSASDCLDADTRELYELSLCYCDFEKLIEEEYINEC